MSLARSALRAPETNTPERTRRAPVALAAIGDRASVSGLFPRFERGGGVHDVERSTASPGGSGGATRRRVSVTRAASVSRQLWFRLARTAGLAASAIQQLPKGPWALFIGMCCPLAGQRGGSGRARSPSPASAGGRPARCGIRPRCSSAAASFACAESDGLTLGADLPHAPGLVTLAALAEFVERFPRERAKTLRERRRRDRRPQSVRPPEAIAAAPPAECSPWNWRRSRSDQTFFLRNERAERNRIRRERRTTIRGYEGLRGYRLACARRACETEASLRPAPRWFDRCWRTRDQVSACSAALARAIAETKLLAHCDAIAGACSWSRRKRPPTVRFIWQKLDHFFDHVDRGRRRRLAEERAAQLRARKAEPAPQPIRLQSPAIPCDRMDADLERLFGPGWRTHVPR